MDERCPQCGATDNSPYETEYGVQMRACGRCMIRWLVTASITTKHKGAAASPASQPEPENMQRDWVEMWAQDFHDTYEKAAPKFGYSTRPESAKPWAEVPENNKRLMRAVCAEVLCRFLKYQGAPPSVPTARQDDNETIRAMIPKWFDRVSGWNDDTAVVFAQLVARTIASRCAELERDVKFWHQAHDGAEARREDAQKALDLARRECRAKEDALIKMEAERDALAEWKKAVEIAFTAGILGMQHEALMGGKKLTAHEFITSLQVAMRQATTEFEQKAQAALADATPKEQQDEKV